MKRALTIGAILAGTGLGVAMLIRRGQRMVGGQLSGLNGPVELGGSRQQGIYAMPEKWWWEDEGKTSSKKLCYRTKKEALQQFIKAGSNDDLIDQMEGDRTDVGTFDALTKFEATPKNWAEALWASLEMSKEEGRKNRYCLDDIDIDALNDVARGIWGELQTGFVLPDFATEKLQKKAQQERWEQMQSGPDKEDFDNLIRIAENVRLAKQERKELNEMMKQERMLLSQQIEDMANNRLLLLPDPSQTTKESIFTYESPDGAERSIMWSVDRKADVSTSRRSPRQALPPLEPEEIPF